jgi:hypothetical protein
MYHAAKNAVHRMLLSLWLYKQSIKSASVYLVGANPMRGASSVQVTITPAHLIHFMFFTITSWGTRRCPG